MIGWAWLGLYLLASEFMARRFPKRVGNGFTGKPLRKLPLGHIGQGRSFVRYMIWLGIAMGLHLTAYCIFFPVILGFILDDYMFGDDDDLKRRWNAVKNSVKWKMKLPEPAPARAGTS